MSEKKPKKEEKPITARPVGSGFLSSYSKSRGGKNNEDSRGRWSEGSMGEGCYRRVPTCKE